MEHLWIPRTAHLCERAIRDLARGANASLRLRGIVPPSWNPVPPPTREWGDVNTWRVKAVDTPPPA
eukprot:6559340-Pyramimonas_sp.AAC.1